MSNILLWVIAVEFWSVAVIATLQGNLWLALYGWCAGLIQVSVIGGMR